MRKAVFCSAFLALAFVTVDHFVANGAVASSAPVAVNRAVKSDRPPLEHFIVPAATVLLKSDAATAKIPEGCETGISPLAKSAKHAPTVRCLS